MSDTSITQEEQEVKITRTCCICHQPFEIDEEVDKAQVLCSGCEKLGIRCGCVMPWQNCAICRAAKALESDYIFGDPIDTSWYGYRLEEVLA